MSTETLHGKIDEGTGKLKQAVGEATGNETLANKGAAQQVKGHVEEAWGAVKDAAKETHDRHKPEAEAHAHNLREKVVEAAQTVKEHIQNAVDPKNKHI